MVVGLRMVLAGLSGPVERSWRLFDSQAIRGRFAADARPARLFIPAGRPAGRLSRAVTSHRTGPREAAVDPVIGA